MRWRKIICLEPSGFERSRNGIKRRKLPYMRKRSQETLELVKALLRYFAIEYILYER